MVNNISMNSGNYIRDIENLVRYASGAAINNSEEGLTLGSVIAFPAIFEGGKAAVWTYKNRKDLSGAYKSFSADATAKSLAAKNMVKNAGGWLNKDAYKALWSNHSASGVVKYVNTTQNAFLNASAMDKYVRAGELAKYSQNAGSVSRSTKALSKANALITEADAIAYSEKMKNPTKLMGKISKYTGFSKLKGASLDFATKSPTWAKMLRGLKGNGAFAAISGGIEMFTNVIPTYKELGFAKGTKQLFKSSAKVGAEVAGWVLGAKAGAVIGSCFGPVGTAIGGFLGMACGMVGSYFASKAVSGALGKDELVKAEEEKSAETAAAASQDPAVAQQIAVKAAQRLQEEGFSSADAQVALASLKNVASSPSFMGNVNQSSTQMASNDQSGYQSETAKSLAQGYNPTANLAANPAVNPAVSQAVNQAAGLVQNPFANANISSGKFDMNKDFMAQSVGLA